MLNLQLGGKQRPLQNHAQDPSCDKMLNLQLGEKQRPLQNHAQDPSYFQNFVGPREKAPGCGVDTGKC